MGNTDDRLIRVGFDFTSGAWQGAGIGRVTRGLLRELINRDTGFACRPFYPGVEPSERANDFFQETPVRCRRIPISERLWLAVSQKLRAPIPMQLALGRFDVYHGPDFVVPVWPGMRSVVTVHDLSYVTHPETAHPAQKRYLDSATPRAIERSSRVIAVSEATRSDVIDVYNARPELVHVVHNGLDPFFSEPSSPDSLHRAGRMVGSFPCFALSVGTIQPRKNLPTMAAAVGLARRRGLDIHLVHVGAEGWLSDEVHSGIAEVDDGFVHFLGPLDDRLLKALYQLARVTLAVSKAEGFMIPIIESMAMGTPVITSNVSSMPEVAASAALLASPDNPDEIAEGIVELVDQPGLAESLKSRGRLRAAEFTWEAAAEKTETVYRAALESS